MPSAPSRATFEATAHGFPVPFPPLDERPLTRRIVSRAPTRIDFGGGWTDVPPYCQREGGFVCNVAIDRYVVATLSQGSSTDLVETPLVQAALKRAGVRASVSLENRFPVGAGLGGSSAASAAILAALAEWKSESWDRSALAETGRAIEVEDLGVAGGRQDHYAATHGGALALTFTDSTTLRRLRLQDSTSRALVDRSLLVYTGESRISGDTITAVLGAYERRESRVTRALAKMKELAREMARALERGDLDGLGELVGEHWQHQRSLHPSIPTERIDEIVSRARSYGAIGSKALGASGGGCVLVIGRPERMDSLRREMSRLGEILDFGLDESGVTILEDEEA